MIRMLRKLKLALAERVFSWRIPPPARQAAELEAAAEGPLVVAGLFSTASGIGESARVCADALERRGFSISRLDLSAVFRQQDVDAEAQAPEIPDAPAGTLILHFNAPETFFALHKLRFFGKRRWRIIGAWVWEFETIPQSWVEASRYLSEIWTPSEFCRSAIEKSVDIPVRLAPYPILPPADFGSSPRLENDAVTVLVMADRRSSLTRKNLEGSIRAFKTAFEGRSDRRLILKTRNLGGYWPEAKKLNDLISGDSRISFVNESVSEIERWRLIDRCDIYLSLHRSEGFGLTIAEAMALGKAVVATGWSGNMDFTDASNAMLAPYELAPVQDASGVYFATGGLRWAEPDIEAAASALRRLADDAALRRQLGEAAKSSLQKRYNGDEYALLLGRQA